MDAETAPSNGQPIGTSETERAGEVERWRLLSARQLKENTVVFSALKGTKLNDYVKALEAAGFSPDSILSIQVSVSGECRLTMADAEATSNLVEGGFSLGSHAFQPRRLEGKSLQLHVHDLPIWISDGVLESILSPYGSIVGAVRHGKFQTARDVYVATGTRFVTFKPKQTYTTIPSYLHTPDSNLTFRVYHEGQRPTCRLCSSLDHLAKDCPYAPSTKAGKSNTHETNDKSSRRWETTQKAQTNHAATTPSPSQSTETVQLGDQHVVDETSTTQKTQSRRSSAELDQPMSVSSTLAEPPSPKNTTETARDRKPNETSNTDKDAFVTDKSNLNQQITQLVESARSSSALNKSEAADPLSFTPVRRPRPSQDSSPEGSDERTTTRTGGKKKTAPSAPKHSVPGSRYSPLANLSQ